MGILEEINDAVIYGKRKDVVAGVEKALIEGYDAGVILHQSMIPAMTEVGLRFERNEFFVPEMLIAARAMQAGIDILRPLLVEGGVEPLGTVAVGTVQGDLHDIGKNLVALMLEGAGFEVRDLGVNVSPDHYVAAAQEGVQIIGLSALLTTTMPAMKAVIDALEAAGVRGQVKVMVGGAPVTQTYADEIGADGYSPDASSATRLAKQLLNIE
ncbi:MAG: cobalamin-binding protein [Chloroflexi bacterium]|nr:cobalamin-binding protein [Chloroflexota bacterium]